jgi:hypothetical protein
MESINYEKIQGMENDYDKLREFKKSAEFEVLQEIISTNTKLLNGLFEDIGLLLNLSKNRKLTIDMDGCIALCTDITEKIK